MQEGELLRWLDEARFGHRGLFVCDEERGYLQVLRFYPDGQVCRATGDTTAEHAYVFSWLKPGDPAASTGRYTVDARRGLRFSLTSGALLSSGPVAVVIDCEATWDGDVLVVRSFSRATGYRATERYGLRDISGMSTLDDAG